MGTDFQSEAKQIFQRSAPVVVILVGMEILVFTFPLAVVATNNMYSNKHRLAFRTTVDIVVLVFVVAIVLMEPGLFCLAAAL